MGVFDDMDQADIFGDRSPYFYPGQHIVQLTGAKVINGHHGETHIIEARILGVRSVHPESSPVGTICAQGFNASKNPAAAKRATETWVKFMCSIYGIAQSDWDAAQWKANIANVIDNNALAGTIVALDCFFKPMEKGGDFTVHNWRGIPSVEELLRFGLDATGAPIPGWIDPSPMAAPVYVPPAPAAAPAPAPAAAPAATPAPAPAAAPAPAPAPAPAAAPAPAPAAAPAAAPAPAPAAAPAPAPAAAPAPARPAAPAPQYAVDAGGRSLISHDGGVSWAFA